MNITAQDLKKEINRRRILRRIKNPAARIICGNEPASRIFFRDMYQLEFLSETKGMFYQRWIERVGARRYKLVDTQHGVKFGTVEEIVPAYNSIVDGSLIGLSEE